MARLLARIWKMVFRQGIQLDRIQRQLARMQADIDAIYTQVIPGDASSLGLTVDEPTEQPKEK